MNRTEAFITGGICAAIVAVVATLFVLGVFEDAQAQDFKTHFKPCEGGMYAAKVKRWIDGDSVVLDVYLGFDVWLVDQRARLARVNTPERGQPDFKTATDLAASTCKNTVYVNDGGRDKYGRLLVEMDCDGVRINDSLRERGWVYD